MDEKLKNEINKVIDLADYKEGVKRERPKSPERLELVVYVLAIVALMGIILDL